MRGTKAATMRRTERSLRVDRCRSFALAGLSRKTCWYNLCTSAFRNLLPSRSPECERARRCEWAEASRPWLLRAFPREITYRACSYTLAYLAATDEPPLLDCHACLSSHVPLASLLGVPRTSPRSRRCQDLGTRARYLPQHEIQRQVAG